MIRSDFNRFPPSFHLNFEFWQSIFVIWCFLAEIQAVYSRFSNISLLSNRFQTIPSNSNPFSSFIPPIISYWISDSLIRLWFFFQILADVYLFNNRFYRIWLVYNRFQSVLLNLKPFSQFFSLFYLLNCELYRSFFIFSLNRINLQSIFQWLGRISIVFKRFHWILKQFSPFSHLNFEFCQLFFVIFDTFQLKSNQLRIDFQWLDCIWNISQRFHWISIQCSPFFPLEFGIFHSFLTNFFIFSIEMDSIYNRVSIQFQFVPKFFKHFYWIFIDFLHFSWIFPIEFWISLFISDCFSISH